MKEFARNALAVLMLCFIGTMVSAYNADEVQRITRAEKIGLPVEATWDEILLLELEAVRMRSALRLGLPVDATWDELRASPSSCNGTVLCFGVESQMDEDDMVVLAINVAEVRTNLTLDIINRVNSE